MLTYYCVWRAHFEIILPTSCVDLPSWVMQNKWLLRRSVSFSSGHFKPFDWFKRSNSQPQNTLVCLLYTSDPLANHFRYNFSTQNTLFPRRWFCVVNNKYSIQVNKKYLLMIVKCPICTTDKILRGIHQKIYN